MTPEEATGVAIEAYAHQHAMQNVHELAEIARIVAALEPARIAEIGCCMGGTLYVWRQLGARTWGITLADPLELRPHGATVLRGDSHDPASLAWLRAELAGELLDVLFIDGDHSEAGALADFGDYAPLVRPGGLVLVHDVAQLPEVTKAWTQISAGPIRTRTVVADVGAEIAGFGIVEM